MGAKLVFSSPIHTIANCRIQLLLFSEKEIPMMKSDRSNSKGFILKLIVRHRTYYKDHKGYTKDMTHIKISQNLCLQ